MKRYITPTGILYFILASFLLNSYLLVKTSPYTLFLLIPLFLLLLDEMFIKS